MCTLLWPNVALIKFPFAEFFSMFDAHMRKQLVIRRRHLNVHSNTQTAKMSFHYVMFCSCYCLEENKTNKKLYRCSTFEIISTSG